MLKITKTILAALSAMLLADFLNVDYGLTAGLMAMLSLQATLKQTLSAAKKRLFSALFALSLSASFFALFGFSFYVWALFLVVFVWVSYQMDMQFAVVPSCVLVGHLYSLQMISVPILINECLIVGIGLGVATTLNMYMPTQSKQIQQQKQELEYLYQLLLQDIAKQLDNQQTKDLKEQLVAIDETLNQLQKLVFNESENRLLKESVYDIAYVDMRKQQLQIVQYMISYTTQVDVIQKRQIMALLNQIAEQVYEENTAQSLIELSNDLYESIRLAPLPKSRDEFEERAMLFQLLNDCQRFLQTKKMFIDEYRHEMTG